MSQMAAIAARCAPSSVEKIALRLIPVIFTGACTVTTVETDLGTK